MRMAASDRRFLRLPEERALAIRHAGPALRDAAEWTGTSRDLSLDGVGFVCGARFQAGAAVEIELCIEGKVLHGTAQVVRATKHDQGWLYGARWLPGDAETARMLEELADA